MGGGEGRGEIEVVPSHWAVGFRILLEVQIIFFFFV